MNTTSSRSVSPLVAGTQAQSLATQTPASVPFPVRNTKPISSVDPALAGLPTFATGLRSAHSAAKSLTAQFRAKTSPAADLVAQVQTATNFVSQSETVNIQPLLDKLKQPPADLESLDAFADILNRVYDSFDHRMSDSNAASYHAELRQWSNSTQQTLYKARDRILKLNPQELKRFGVAEQFGRMFPGEQKPVQLVQFESSHGQIIFNGEVKNDCGVFATALRNEIKLKQIAAFIKDNGLDKTKELSDQHLAELVSTSVSTTCRTDKLVYDKDSPLPYPHHVKTAIAQSDGRIFTLEANTGKPFLLAPELLAHDNEHALLEIDDPTIERRQSMSVASDLQQELGPFKTSKERYASVAQAINSHNQTLNPLGQNATPAITLPIATAPLMRGKDLRGLF